MATHFEFLLSGMCPAAQMPDLLNILRGLSTTATSDARWIEQQFKHDANQALGIPESVAILRTTFSSTGKTMVLRYAGYPLPVDKPITMRASIEVKLNGRVVPALLLMGFKMQHESLRSGHLYRTAKGISVSVFRMLRSEPGKPPESVPEPDPATPYQVQLSLTGPKDSQLQLADDALAFAEYLKPYVELRGGASLASPGALPGAGLAGGLPHLGAGVSLTAAAGQRVMGR